MFFDELLGDTAGATRVVSIRIRRRVLGSTFGALAPYWKEIEEVIDLPEVATSGLDTISGPSLFETAGLIPKPQSAIDATNSPNGQSRGRRGSNREVEAAVKVYLRIQLMLGEKPEHRPLQQMGVEAVVPRRWPRSSARLLQRSRRAPSARYAEEENREINRGIKSRESVSRDQIDFDRGFPSYEIVPRFVLPLRGVRKMPSLSTAVLTAGQPRPHAQGGIIASIEKRTCDRVFLDFIDQTTAENRPVSQNTRAGNYAPKLFAKRQHSEKFKAKDFERAMERLFAAGEVANVAYGRPSAKCYQIARKSNGNEPQEPNS